MTVIQVSGYFDVKTKTRILKLKEISIKKIAEIVKILHDKDDDRHNIIIGQDTMRLDGDYAIDNINWTCTIAKLGEYAVYDNDMFIFYGQKNFLGEKIKTKQELINMIIEPKDLKCYANVLFHSKIKFKLVEE